MKQQPGYNPCHDCGIEDPRKCGNKSCAEHPAQKRKLSDWNRLGVKAKLVAAYDWR